MSDMWTDLNEAILLILNHHRPGMSEIKSSLIADKATQDIVEKVAWGDIGIDEWDA